MGKLDDNIIYVEVTEDINKSIKDMIGYDMFDKLVEYIMNRNKHKGRPSKS